MPGYITAKTIAFLFVIGAIYCTVEAGSLAAIAFACGLGFCGFDAIGEWYWKRRTR